MSGSAGPVLAKVVRRTKRSILGRDRLLKHKQRGFSDRTSDNRGVPDLVTGHL